MPSSIAGVPKRATYNTVRRECPVVKGSTGASVLARRHVRFAASRRRPARPATNVLPLDRLPHDAVGVVGQRLAGRVIGGNCYAVLAGRSPDDLGRQPDLVGDLPGTVTGGGHLGDLGAAVSRGHCPVPPGRIGQCAYVLEQSVAGDGAGLDEFLGLLLVLGEQPELVHGVFGEIKHFARRRSVSSGPCLDVLAWPEKLADQDLRAPRLGRQQILGFPVRDVAAVRLKLTSHLLGGIDPAGGSDRLAQGRGAP